MLNEEHLTKIKKYFTDLFLPDAFYIYETFQQRGKFSLHSDSKGKSYGLGPITGKLFRDLGVWKNEGYANKNPKCEFEIIVKTPLNSILVTHYNYSVIAKVIE